MLALALAALTQARRQLMVDEVVAAVRTAAANAGIDVDLDAIYGPGTVELRGRMETLVLLKWRRDGQGSRVRSLAPEDALADLPYFYKNLGAFDPDRPAGSPITNSERARYGELLGRVRVVEVTGRVDFKALVGLVEQLLP